MNTGKDHPDNWDLEIRPRKGLLDLKLQEAWRYRDLMMLFVKRDFISQYKQTVLGPLWHFIQPILTTLMFLLVFSKIAKIPTDGVPPILFYISGITLWNYFSTSLTATSNVFVTNSAIFGKVYFPRLILPVSIVCSNMIRFGIQFLLLLVTMVWYQFHGYPIVLSVNWLFIPIIVFQLACLALGLGIIISSLTTKYRDFSVLLTFIVQLGMYITPVVYPLSFLKGKGYRWIVEANPISPLIEAFRFSVFGTGTFEIAGLIYSAGFTVVVFLLGLITFNRVQDSFMDTV